MHHSPSRRTAAVPCVARHKVTREKRVWADRYTADRWFKYKNPEGLDPAEWNFADDEFVPFWSSGMPHPREDGTDGMGPLYDTPDGKPAG
jgi:hypothetical protein